MSIPAIYKRLSDATVRIEAAWPFPVFEPSESLAEAFEDAEDRIPAEIAALCERWSAEERELLFTGGGCEFDDAFGELCAQAYDKGISGWLGAAASPVYTAQKDGNGASFSWGHYRTKFLFAETADGLLERASEWAEGEYRKVIGKAAA